MDKSIDKEKNIIDDGYEMRAEDLIVVKKNRKSAIFNKETSEFITEHLYDEIILSDSGNHVVYNEDLFMDITYSAIVNNQGKITEFPNLIFGYSGGFNMFNRCIAKLKGTDLEYLVDNKGNLISNGYTRINRLSKKDDFGIYCAVNHYPLGNGYKIKERKIINSDGKELKFTISNEGADNDIQAPELQDMNNIEFYVRNFGPNIILLIPKEMFKKIEIYPIIMMAVNTFAKLHPMLRKVMINTIELLERMVSIYTPVKSDNIKVEFLQHKEIFAPTQIEANQITRKVREFYERLNLI